MYFIFDYIADKKKKTKLKIQKLTKTFQKTLYNLAHFNYITYH